MSLYDNTINITKIKNHTIAKASHIETTAYALIATFSLLTLFYILSYLLKKK